MDMDFLSSKERERVEGILLQNIRQHEADLHRVLQEVNNEWVYEDGIYRYYHQSMKPFHLQSATLDMVAALRAIAPEGRPFHGLFQQIIEQGEMMPEISVR